MWSDDIAIPFVFIKTCCQRTKGLFYETKKTSIFFGILYLKWLIPDILKVAETFCVWFPEYAILDISLVLSREHSPVVRKLHFLILTKLTQVLVLIIHYVQYIHALVHTCVFPYSTYICGPFTQSQNRKSSCKSAAGTLLSMKPNSVTHCIHHAVNCRTKSALHLLEYSLHVANGIC